MPKYVLSLLVKPKFKNLLSGFPLQIARYRGKRQNQRVAVIDIVFSSPVHVL